MIVAVSSAEEAAHLAGLPRAGVVRSLVESYVVKTRISTHVTKYPRVPPYSQGTAAR